MKGCRLYARLLQTTNHVGYSFLFIIIIIIIVVELTHSKTIPEITVKIEPQPAALDFKNLS